MLSGYKELVAKFIGRGIKPAPVVIKVVSRPDDERSRWNEYMRQRRARFYAQGLNNEGKPRKRVYRGLLAV